MAVSNFMIGVILNLAGSICINLGNNLMSLGHQDGNTRHSRRISPGSDDEEDEEVLPQDGNLAEVERLLHAGHGNLAELEISKEVEELGKKLLEEVEEVGKTARRRLSKSFESAQGLFTRYSKAEIADEEPQRNNEEHEKEAEATSKDTAGKDRSKVAPAGIVHLEPIIVSKPQSSPAPPSPPFGAAPRMKATRVKNKKMIPTIFSSRLLDDSTPKATLGALRGGFEPSPPTTTEKIEESEEPPKQSEDEKTKHSNTWLLGTGIFVCGSLLNFWSFGYAPQSTLASLESSQFVANVVFARVILGAKITTRQLVGTTMLVIGCTTVVMSSRQTTTEYTADDLMLLYTRVPYIAFLCTAASMLIGSRVVYNKYSKAVSEGKTLPNTNAVLPITYCVFSAIIGTQQFLFAKCLSELLRLTLEGDNQMVNPFTYFCLVMWIFTAVYWVYRMNDALKRFRGEFIIPVLQVHFTVIAIISGGIYFEELIGLPAFCCPGYTGFFSGVCVVFVGIYLLAPPDTKKHDADIKLKIQEHSVTFEEKHRRSLSQNAILKK